MKVNDKLAEQIRLSPFFYFFKQSLTVILCKAFCLFLEVSVALQQAEQNITSVKKRCRV